MKNDILCYLNTLHWSFGVFLNNCNYNHCDRQTIHGLVQTVISRRESHIETELELLFA